MLMMLEGAGPEIQLLGAVQQHQLMFIMLGWALRLVLMMLGSFFAGLGPRETS